MAKAVGGRPHGSAVTPIKTVGIGVLVGVMVEGVVGSAVFVAVACGGDVGWLGREVGGTAVGGTAVGGSGIGVRVGMVCAATVCCVILARRAMMANRMMAMRKGISERKRGIKPLNMELSPH